MTLRAAAAPIWIHDLTFIAAIALPEPWADEFGTTVNGMWADPDRWDSGSVAEAHAAGRRILVSVPLIALTHQVYERSELAYLMDEVCRDLDGNPAEVEWYYWDAKPVYSLCIHSPVLRSHLVDRLRGAIAAGVDVVNVDEINTSVGLMTREPKGSGFCHRCLSGSNALVQQARERGVAEATDDELRSWLRTDDAVYAAFESEQQERAFSEASELLAELRDLARSQERPVAFTANVAGLGAFVANHGPLWSAMWGELLDVVMLEAIYVVAQSQFEDPQAHKLLPRGTFAPLYRLGRALGPRAPIWIAPQINVPRQLSGQRRQRYYELMFLEAYTNLGRWGYNWWPGVDDATRRAATAPDAIKTWTSFLRDHAELYVGLATQNEVALVYSNAAVLADPATHRRFLGLAQAMYEDGVQFDVLYTGDDRFAPSDLDHSALARYRQVLVPGIDGITSSQRRALEAHATRGGTVTGLLAASNEAAVVDRFWNEYRPGDRSLIVEMMALRPEASIIATAARVVATRYVRPDGRTLLHLLNYDYVEAEDDVRPAGRFTLSVPWAAGAPGSIRLVMPAGTHELESELHSDRLEIVVPDLRDHGVIEVAS